MKQFFSTKWDFRVYGRRTTRLFILFDWGLPESLLRWRHRGFFRLKEWHWQCSRLNLRLCCSRKAAIHFRWWCFWGVLRPFHCPEVNRVFERSIQVPWGSYLVWMTKWPIGPWGSVWRRVGIPRLLRGHRKLRKGRFPYWCDGRVWHPPCICASLDRERGYLASSTLRLLFCRVGIFAPFWRWQVVTGRLHPLYNSWY